MIEQALITILVPITAACAFVIRGMWKTISAEREQLIKQREALERERKTHLRLLFKYHNALSNHFKHDETYQKEVLENLKLLNERLRLW